MSKLSTSIGALYIDWKREAAGRGWQIPPEGSHVSHPDWHEAWVRYWQAMDDYEEKIASGDQDPGRPVVPHRTGRAVGG